MDFLSLLKMGENLFYWCLVKILWSEYVLNGQKHYESCICINTFCLYICFCAYSAPMPLFTFNRKCIKIKKVA